MLDRVVEATTSSKGGDEYLEQKHHQVGRQEVEENIPLQLPISNETLVFSCLNPCPAWLFLLGDLGSGTKSKMGETLTDNQDIF